MFRQLKSFFAAKRRGFAFGFLPAVFLLLGVAFIGGLAVGEKDSGYKNQLADQPTEAAWGHQAVASGLPMGWLDAVIPPVNACSAGASSCFQCHNGVRAGSPPEDAWHADHNSVNNSCAGCHKGNARILREDLAHRNMISNPLIQAQESCASCHFGEDLDALVGKYQEGLKTSALRWHP